MWEEIVLLWRKEPSTGVDLETTTTEVRFQSIWMQWDHRPLLTMQAVPTTDHPQTGRCFALLKPLLFRQHLLQSVQKESLDSFLAAHRDFFFFLAGKLLLRAGCLRANNRVTPSSKLGNGILKCNQCPRSLLGPCKKPLSSRKCTV